VAVTAYAMVGDRQKVLAAGFDGYLTKPLNPEIFVKQVEAFLLPGQRSRPLESHAPVGEAVPLPPQRARVLVVDDTSVNLDLMRSILEPSGFAVEVARQVGEALALARRAAPDLILSDLYMPVQDGFELLRAVKGDPELSHIPVILYSVVGGSPKEQAEAQSLGAAKFLTAPVEPPALVAEIEACLRTTSDPEGSKNLRGSK
jgi:two-component system cell cycle response regulator